jgi:hypothetical protein
MALYLMRTLLDLPEDIDLCAFLGFDLSLGEGMWK